MRYTFILFTAFIAFYLLAPQGAAKEDSGLWQKGEVFAAKPAKREITLVGYTRARHVMNIVSEEAGRCLEVRADVGDPIGKSGIFAALDSTFIELAIRKNSVNQKRLQNLIAYYSKEVRRYEKLVQRETAAQSKLDALQNRLDQAEYEMRALKVEETHLKERLTRHLIKVPLGWVVTERRVEPGEWVTAGQRIGRAADFRTLLVPFALSPDEYTALTGLDRPIKVLLPDTPEGGRVLKAWVERVSPAFDPDTRKINVDLAVRQGISEKRGGLRAELVLKVPDPSGAVLVPASAVVGRYEEFWLVRANGTKVPVLYLGSAPENASRVRSSEVKPGDRFKTKP